MKNVKQVSKFELFSAGLSALFVIVLLFSCSKNMDDAPVHENAQLNAASQSSQSNTRNSIVAVPFENTVFVPCANGGAGEDVTLSGKTNFVYQLAWNEQGFTLVYHDNSYQITGVGLTTGETFGASGGTQGTVKGFWFSGQWVGNMVRQLRIVGQNTNFTVSSKLKLIVTPDGEVKVSVDEDTIDCN
jgi:hypothetical protein